MFSAQTRKSTSPRELSLAVVGLDFANADRSNRRFEMAMCTPGEQLHLMREPNNKHDSRAVAVKSARGVQLGYLSAERCGLIGRWLDAGDRYEAVFQEPGLTAAIIRVRFGGGRMTLPHQRQDVVNDGIEERGDAFDWGC